MSERLTVVVVDDEPLARAGLRTLLAADREVELVAECADGGSAVEIVQRDRPDILFLDVQMPDIDGFDVLRALAPARLPVIVFVTAYDRYAIQAFDVHAVDYLLKPFDDSRFTEALSHAKADRTRAEGGRRRVAGELGCWRTPSVGRPVRLASWCGRAGGYCFCRRRTSIGSRPPTTT